MCLPDSPDRLLRRLPKCTLILRPLRSATDLAMIPAARVRRSFLKMLVLSPAGLSRSGYERSVRRRNCHHGIGSALRTRDYESHPRAPAALTVDAAFSTPRILPRSSWPPFFTMWSAAASSFMNPNSCSSCCSPWRGNRSRTKSAATPALRPRQPPGGRILFGTQFEQTRGSGPFSRRHRRG